MNPSRVFREWRTVADFEHGQDEDVDIKDKGARNNKVIKNTHRETSIRMWDMIQTDDIYCGPQGEKGWA